VQAQPAAFDRLPSPNPHEHKGVTMEIGGPWAFYEDFRAAHDLVDLPKAAVPEISIAAGSLLQLPVVLRNDDAEPVEVTLSAPLPEGWALKSPLPHYKLAPGDVFPIEIEITTPAKKSDQISEITCRANARGKEIGTVKLRVRLAGGGLPQ
jgi:hypothetical protein